MPVLQDFLDLCVRYHIGKSITAKQQTIAVLQTQTARINKKILFCPDGTRQNIFAWMVPGFRLDRLDASGSYNSAALFDFSS